MIGQGEIRVGSGSGMVIGKSSISDLESLIRSNGVSTNLVRSAFPCL